jgi:FHA domain
VKSDDSSRHTTPRIVDAAESEAGPMTEPGIARYWIEYKNRQFDVRTGPVAIGRSAACQLVLDDALVSRRHAQVLLLPDGKVWIEDLDSVNGVYVNGERIEKRVALEPGDRIVIGQQEMVLRALARSSLPPAQTQRFMAETLSGLDAPAFSARPTLTEPSVEDADSESTHQGDALELLGGVADKVLALGRGEEAEKILSAYLQNILKKVRMQGTVEPGVPEQAVAYAIKLASATSKGQWIDYVFELFTVLKRPLPSDAVDELYSVLRKVKDINLGVLRGYVAALRAVRQKFGPADRFLTQRIEGLERLASR